MRQGHRIRNQQSRRKAKVEQNQAELRVFVHFMESFWVYLTKEIEDGAARQRKKEKGNPEGV